MDRSVQEFGGALLPLDVQLPDAQTRNLSKLEVGLALTSVGVALAVAGLAMGESDAERAIRKANEARDAALKKQLADQERIKENARRDAEAAKRFTPKVNRKDS